jgi:hypothetical protein
MKPESSINLIRETNLKTWNNFIDENLQQVLNLQLADVPYDTDYSIVIIEPRSHHHLEFIIRSALRCLGSNWGVTFFCGRENRQYVECIGNMLGGFKIIELDVANLSTTEYNYLKKTTWLWEQIDAEHVLWLEPDCLILRPGIEEYLKYDYIGAPWHPMFSPSPACRVGNGGLSLRKRSAMLKVSKQCNPDVKVIFPEDNYFVTNMTMWNQQKPGTFRIAPLTVAKTFAVESVFYPTPFGLHKSWNYLKPKFFNQLLQSFQY